MVRSASCEPYCKKYFFGAMFIGCALISCCAGLFKFAVREAAIYTNSLLGRKAKWYKELSLYSKDKWLMRMAGLIKQFFTPSKEDLKIRESMQNYDTMRVIGRGALSIDAREVRKQNKSTQSNFSRYTENGRGINQK